MSFPRYPEYKDSGVEWLGEVPRHWQRRTLRDTAAPERNAFVDGPFGSDLKNEEYVDDGVPLIQLNNISVGKHDLGNLKFIPESKALQLSRHKALPGDLVIAKMASPVARAAIVDSAYGSYVIVADCVRLSVDHSTWDRRYIEYWINCAEINGIAETLSGGITRLRINLGALKKLPIFQNSLEEQAEISTFLDHETAKIDALVAEQEKLITLLKEKRQAVISHAVTKGLNPDAPMKDSGIEWLGEVPAHWDVLRLRRCAASVETGGTPANQPPDSDIDDGFTWYTPGDFSDSINLVSSCRKVCHESVLAGDVKVFPPRSVLVVSIGATLGKVGFTKTACSANQQINAVIPGSLIDGYFLAWSLSAKAEVMRFLSNASTIGIMNQEKTKDIWLAVPPVGEQQKVTELLEVETEQIDSLIDVAHAAVALLKERRSALISAAVTGKIDVRGFAAEKEAA